MLPTCPLLFIICIIGDRCFPFTIKYDEDVGHYMVAVRDIKQMEVILTENPVVMGPYTNMDSLHCVECFKAGNHTLFLL